MVPSYDGDSGAVVSNRLRGISIGKRNWSEVRIGYSKSLIGVLAFRMHISKNAKLSSDQLRTSENGNHPQRRMPASMPHNASRYLHFLYRMSVYTLCGRPKILEFHCQRPPNGCLFRKSGGHWTEISLRLTKRNFYSGIRSNGGTMSPNVFPVHRYSEISATIYPYYFFRDIIIPTYSFRYHGHNINCPRPRNLSYRLQFWFKLIGWIGKEILGGEKLGDTRQMTSVKKTKRLKKGSTISRTIEEAKVLLGSDVKLADVDAARSLRVRSNRPDKLVAVKKRKAPGGRGTGVQSALQLDELSDIRRKRSICADREAWLMIIRCLRDLRAPSQSLVAGIAFPAAIRSADPDGIQCSFSRVGCLGQTVPRAENIASFISRHSTFKNTLVIRMTVHLR
ncbi:hypothetical protein CLF_109426 [Clonorchis sinensis]|uniref:Uncharacterized protein n=1 Tax=Clonorchis sinensis TaxID=79923 RepID=G7YSL2_CLOSI|nr:hypothetical protein CLF_109426 [Clonorchis sinensis]